MASTMAVSLATSIPKLTTYLPYPNTSSSSSISFSTSISQLRSSWTGLRFAAITFSKQFVSKDRRRRGCRGNVVYASLFGVGAPEALVIGVVALLVFGPKGLAEVARNLGKTLRAFQPTIRELQDVSREFKSTLEREIGLDDIANPVRNTYTTTTQTPKSAPTPASSSDSVQTPVEFTDGSPSLNQAYTSEEYLKITEEQLKASAAAAWQQEQGSSTVEEQKKSESTVQESNSTGSPPSPAKLDGETSS